MEDRHKHVRPDQADGDAQSTVPAAREEDAAEDGGPEPVTDWRQDAPQNLGRDQAAERERDRTPLADEQRACSA